MYRAIQSALFTFLLADVAKVLFRSDEQNTLNPCSITRKDIRDSFQRSSDKSSRSHGSVFPSTIGIAPPQWPDSSSESTISFNWKTSRWQKITVISSNEQSR
jgi:hypothetical protein